jgi:putative phage-type endonuclease
MNDKYLDKLIESINKVLKRKKIVTHDEKNKMWFIIDEQLKTEIEDYNSNICKQLYDNLFVCSYKYDLENKSNIEIIYNEVIKQSVEIQTDIQIEDQNIYDIKTRTLLNIDENPIVIPVEYQRKMDIFNKLKTVPQAEQKSPEWYKQREGMITASVIATIMNDDPYSNPSKLLNEKIRGSVFKDNISTYHGKKFEPIAQKFYSQINNVELNEFGVIRSEKYDFIGASPDGICSYRTLDNNFSQLLGRMIEIKCPLMRDIKTSGNLYKKGKQEGIVPYNYWYQMQTQMEVCNLDECDFFQCNISEYNSREDFLNDINLGNEYYINQGEKIKVKDTLKKGCIIELMPCKYIENPHIFLAKYEYPETIDMTILQYDKWVMDYISDFSVKNKLSKEYYIYRIVYWKMNKTHTQLIHRDTKWFNDAVPKLSDFWKKVLYYKEHIEELDNYLEKLSETEKSLNTNDYFRNKIPEMYKKLSNIMDLTKSPSEEVVKTPNNLTKIYNKNNIFIKPKELSNNSYSKKNQLQYEFLSDT